MLSSPVHSMASIAEHLDLRGSVRSVDHSRCHFFPENDPSIVVVASLEWPWLVLRLPWNKASDVSAGASLDELMRRNAQLAADVKVVLNNASDELQLIGEVLLEDDADCWSELPVVLDGLLQAAEWKSGMASDAGPTPARANQTVHQMPPPSVEELAEAIESSRWLIDRRVADRIAVTLDVIHGGFHQAIVSPRNGRFVAEVALAPWHELAPDCQHAVAHFVLSVAEELRLVRPYVLGHVGVATIGWQACWQQLPTVRQVQQAMTALSIACDETANEVLALHDEALARNYLSLRGRSS